MKKIARWLCVSVMIVSILCGNVSVFAHEGAGSDTADNTAIVHRHEKENENPAANELERFPPLVWTAKPSSLRMAQRACSLTMITGRRA